MPCFQLAAGNTMCHFHAGSSCGRRRCRDAPGGEGGGGASDEDDERDNDDDEDEEGYEQRRPLGMCDKRSPLANSEGTVPHDGAAVQTPTAAAPLLPATLDGQWRCVFEKHGAVERQCRVTNGRVAYDDGSDFAIAVSDGQVSSLGGAGGGGAGGPRATARDLLARDSEIVGTADGARERPLAFVSRAVSSSLAPPLTV